MNPYFCILFLVFQTTGVNYLQLTYDCSVNVPDFIPNKLSIFIKNNLYFLNVALSIAGRIDIIVSVIVENMSTLLYQYFFNPSYEFASCSFATFIVQQSAEIFLFFTFMQS